MLRSNKISWLLILLAIFKLAEAGAWGGQPARGCQLSGVAAESLLSRHLPAGEVSGSLGREVIPFLHQRGVPVSFISRAAGDSRVHLKWSSSLTVRELLAEIVRQVPEYRYRGVRDKIVLYPDGEGYDQHVKVESEAGVKRAKALYELLRALKSEVKALENLRMPVLWGGGNTIYGDIVEVGGTYAVVEHLASLLQGRPSSTFQMLVAPEGYLYFEFGRAALFKKIEIIAPRTVGVGVSFHVAVKGELFDTAAIVLEGPECYVKYGVTRDEVLRIDERGKAVALQKGEATILVQYEDHFAQVDVEVK